MHSMVMAAASTMGLVGRHPTQPESAKLSTYQQGKTLVQVKLEEIFSFNTHKNTNG
jgi:hypothetical protein